MLLLLLPFAYLLTPGSQAGEIIGGREVMPHSRPYMALVTIQSQRDKRSCGGFLIREDVVVTAAHCNCNLRNITVLLGAHDIALGQQDEPQRQQILVRRRIPHPEYNDEMFQNDIMLLQLKEKAKLSRAIATISVSKKKAKEGSVCSVAGWGRTSSKAKVQPVTTLQEVELKVMSSDLCHSLFHQYYVPSKMLCMGDPKKRKASFQGDSGGPLICDGKVKGVVSYGRDDGSPPRVFTRVSEYVLWIRKTLRHLRP
ncbi:granzyme B(G,H)-like [Carettochelys insculpta]|uniref:granzyme B(G,H)-like n=1 Tax=Carettochelys insculpta TaxID=44489 RepID=UPI003EBAE349